jgi:hypothetical protein
MELVILILIQTIFIVFISLFCLCFFFWFFFSFFFHYCCFRLFFYFRYIFFSFFLDYWSFWFLLGFRFWFSIFRRFLLFLNCTFYDFSYFFYFAANVLNYLLDFSNRISNPLFLIHFLYHCLWCCHYFSYCSILDYLSRSDLFLFSNWLWQNSCFLLCRFECKKVL